MGVTSGNNRVTIQCYFMVCNIQPKKDRKATQIGIYHNQTDTLRSHELVLTRRVN